jgi:hypothetical protein
MRVSLRFCRRLLLVCVGLLVAVSLVVVIGVIPPVSGDTFPGSTPEDAIPAFWGCVVLSLLVAAALGFTAIRTKGRSWLSTAVLILLTILVLFLALLLGDAAAAYDAEGPAMHTATILLLICVAADLLTAVLVITTAFLLPKRT